MTDITANRHGGNPQSEAANRRIDPYKRTMKDRICEHIGDCEGVTAEEIVRHMGFKLQSVSARCAELKAEKKIVEQGTRNGYSILRLAAPQRSLFQ